eukprot:scaffold80305_cov68-Cyclotella_meneghiniana.AAC.4
MEWRYIDYGDAHGRVVEECGMCMIERKRDIRTENGQPQQHQKSRVLCGDQASSIILRHHPYACAIFKVRHQGIAEAIHHTSF